MNKIKNIAVNGICDFDCDWCRLKKDCSGYNHKDSDPVLDQKDIRKRFAEEYLISANMRSSI